MQCIERSEFSFCAVEVRDFNNRKSLAPCSERKVPMTLRNQVLFKVGRECAPQNIKYPQDISIYMTAYISGRITSPFSFVGIAGYSVSSDSVDTAGFPVSDPMVCSLFWSGAFLILCFQFPKPKQSSPAQTSFQFVQFPKQKLSFPAQTLFLSG